MQVLVDVESRVCCGKVLDAGGMGRWWGVFFCLGWRVEGGWWRVGMGVVRKAEVGEGGGWLGWMDGRRRKGWVGEKDGWMGGWVRRR